MFRRRGAHRAARGSDCRKSPGSLTADSSAVKVACVVTGLCPVSRGGALPPHGPVRLTDPLSLEPRFQLDSSARPFMIDEYLCITMDKYACTKKIRIGKARDGGTRNKTCGGPT